MKPTVSTFKRRVIGTIRRIDHSLGTVVIVNDKVESNVDIQDLLSNGIIPEIGDMINFTTHTIRTK